MLLITIFTYLLSILPGHSQSDIEIKITDSHNNPIEGVYVKCNKQFWHTNINGTIRLNAPHIHENDSIIFSHLSYQTMGMTIKDLKQLPTFPNVIMNEDSKELKEVAVTGFDAAKYVKEAVEKIPENYTSIYEPYINLDADITITQNDENKELLRYKGILHLASENKDIYVSKIPETEEILADLKKNTFFIKPYKSFSILSIDKHHVIRRHKKYQFYDYDFIKYKNKDAVKIYFKEKSKNPWEGNLIIDKETKAILSVSYNVENINTWIVGTMKGKGMVKTAIDRYIVEADYTQDAETGKFIFDSGRENIDSKSRWKDHVVSTSSDIFFKRNTNNIDITENTNKKKTKELFLK